jgi:SAM-dependent methyltransferase/rhodanese-related sulfurtransferase
MNDNETILDVRSEARFAAGHAAGAANIPLEELAGRAHELPPKGSTLNLFDDDPERRRAAADALRLRGYEVRETPLAPENLCETGPSRARLWQPSPFLVEALDLIRSQAAGQPPILRGGSPDPPRETRVESAAPVPCAAGPETRRAEPATRRAECCGQPLIALDLACGTGRDAVYMAMCGYEVEAIDILPDALERARDLARRHGVNLTTIEQDLRRAPALPTGRYDLVVVMRFLHRPLMAGIGRSVVAGGFVVYEAFNRRDSPEGRKPLPPAGALADGELAAAFPDFASLIARDGVERGGRTFSQLLAQRRLGC